MRRRTKKRYLDLYDNPKLLCPTTDSSPGASVILFPDGENEIWVKTDDGLGFRLVIGSGPHGLSVRARAFVATPGLDDDASIRDEREITICQYRTDAKSQEFRRWYLDDAIKPKF